MSVDPDLAETDQPYAYAGDDPVNESDPSGDWVWLFGITHGFSPDDAQDFVATLLAPSQTEVPFRNINYGVWVTPDDFLEEGFGSRQVDVYSTVPHWINEVKTGYIVDRSKYPYHLQAEKDAGLALPGAAVAGGNPPVNGAVWWFLPNTGCKTGTTSSFLSFLIHQKINVVIFICDPDADDNEYVTNRSKAAYLQTANLNVNMWDYFPQPQIFPASAFTGLSSTTSNPCL
jgi:hypothetical protein